MGPTSAQLPGGQEAVEGQGQSCPHLPESPAGGKGPSQVPSRGSSSRVRPDDSGASSVPAAGGTRRVRPPPYSPGFLAPPGQGQVLGKQPGTREDRLSVFTAISVPAASDHYSGANPGFRPHLILTILKTVPPHLPEGTVCLPRSYPQVLSTQRQPCSPGVSAASTQTPLYKRPGTQMQTSPT